MTGRERDTARRVGRYFETHSRRYDELYGERHSPVQRLVNRLLHRVIQERFDLTFARCGPLGGKRVLDIGCGSGRYAVRFAQEGAAEVVAIDLSPRMLELAEARARAAGVADRCRFERADFARAAFRGPFDIITAIGLFDYVAEPEPLLVKMRGLSRGRAFASFPMRWQVRALIRRLSFLPSGCPIYFYDRRDVARLWADAGFGRWEVVALDRDYFVLADADGGFD
ncbi:MAG: methyltransferase domain-containing protein [Candidatus Rokubacteria bacterium]|nr:methyltransferase domain-containing protein [Candidatus Rokubacteria bacterium]